MSKTFIAVLFRLHLFGLFVVFWTPSLAAQTWTDVAAAIEQHLDRAVALYSEGKGEEAKQERYDAYFQLYELEEMEQAVQSWFGGKHNFYLEDLFAEITRIVNEGRPVQDLMAVRDELVQALYQDAKELDVELPRTAISAVSIFWKAFLILLREGMEAILIIAAITAVLVKRQRREQIKYVYWASLAALAASVLLAVLLNALIVQIGVTAGLVAREIFEGFVILFAVAVLLWVGGWLLKAHHGGIGKLKADVASSSDASRMGVLGSLVFLAVFREGAETVLFYQALFADIAPERYGLLGLGMLAAAVVLASGFFLVRMGAMRLPFGAFFLFTGLFILYLAFTMAGQAFVEFKEAGWFENTVVSFPTLPILGIYPILPGLLLQALILLFAILTFWHQRRAKRIQNKNSQ